MNECVPVKTCICDELRQHLRAEDTCLAAVIIDSLLAQEEQVRLMLLGHCSQHLGDGKGLQVCIVRQHMDALVRADGQSSPKLILSGF